MRALGRFVYKIPNRQARAWPSAIRPLTKCAHEQGILHTIGCLAKHARKLYWVFYILVFGPSNIVSLVPKNTSDRADNDPVKIISNAQEAHIQLNLILQHGKFVKFTLKGNFWYQSYQNLHLTRCIPLKIGRWLGQINL